LTTITIRISGGGYIDVPCRNLEPWRTQYWDYQGEINETSYLMIGTGENFPFDSYQLVFKVYDISPFIANYSLDSKEVNALFGGQKRFTLIDQWEGIGFLPINYLESDEVSFQIRRTQSAFVFYILEFLLPIIFCYYLLGAIPIIDAVKNLEGRLTICLSIFVFSAAFMIQIRDFLPYRSTLSFLEMLLVVLIASNAIFVITSIIANRKARAEKSKAKKEEKIADTDKWGAVVALFFFIIIYWITLLGRLNLVYALIVVYLILPAYLYSEAIPILITVPMKGWPKLLFEKGKKINFYTIIFLTPLIFLLTIEILVWLFTGSLLPIF
jgi:hypothetical protein